MKDGSGILRVEELGVGRMRALVEDPWPGISDGGFEQDVKYNKRRR